MMSVSRTSYSEYGTAKGTTQCLNNVLLLAFANNRGIQRGHLMWCLRDSDEKLYTEIADVVGCSPESSRRIAWLGGSSPFENSVNPYLHVTQTLTGCLHTSGFAQHDEAGVSKLHPKWPLLRDIQPRDLLNPPKNEKLPGQTCY
jgi:hypothetical protein